MGGRRVEGDRRRENGGMGRIEENGEGSGGR